MLAENAPLLINIRKPKESMHAWPCWWQPAGPCLNCSTRTCGLDECDANCGCIRLCTFSVEWWFKHDQCCLFGCVTYSRWCNWCVWLRHAKKKIPNTFLTAWALIQHYPKDEAGCQCIQNQEGVFGHDCHNAFTFRCSLTKNLLLFCWPVLNQLGTIIVQC